jgi:hypothetical protein
MSRPLFVAALVKQVPKGDHSGRLNDAHLVEGLRDRVSG